MRLCVSEQKSQNPQPGLSNSNRHAAAPPTLMPPVGSWLRSLSILSTSVPHPLANHTVNLSRGLDPIHPVFPVESLVHIVGTQYMCVAGMDGWLDWLLTCCRDGLSFWMKYLNRSPKAGRQVRATFPMADDCEHSGRLTVAGKICHVKYDFNLPLG